MKPFRIITAGYEVTHENFKEVAEKISSAHGCCPALNDIIYAIAGADESATHDRKGLREACNRAIKLIGYKPSYFNAKMRELGPEYADHE